MTDLGEKQVLVTGGCGSIGSALVERILSKSPQSLRVLDSNEHGLFQLQRRLGDDAEKLRPLLGDIRDRGRLALAMEDVDVVFHAAALKHVELNEYNPFEAVQTNVQGTQNLVRLAIEEEIEALVGISTDKASNPTSVMGATKLLAERLIIAGNAYKGERDTRLGCVRFGNILGSSGSVIPLFEDQIRSGGPITVTDPEMTRFVMSPERAVDLVLRAYERMSGGEVFVFKMPGVELDTLASAAKEAFAPLAGYEATDIETAIIGPRPGERTHEKLISIDELPHVDELDDMFVLLPQIDIAGYRGSKPPDTPVLQQEYTSNNADFLEKDELVELLRRAQTDR